MTSLSEAASNIANWSRDTDSSVVIVIFVLLVPKVLLLPSSVDVFNSVETSMSEAVLMLAVISWSVSIAA